jgi:6-pyruvoyltetrahydropterin/6-carboxytetrahydropterin synthase
MYLTVSKRFEFSASRRLAVATLDAEKNREIYGHGSAGRYGTGRNYVATVVFHGDIDRQTGMLINVTDIKKQITGLLAERYDHKFLNGDTPPFDTITPTPERVARQMLHDTRPLFEDLPATPVVCHLDETPERSATAYEDDRIESHYLLTFSSARRTMSPHLSDEENERLFGISTALHGHNYVLRMTLAADLDDVSGLLMPQNEVDMALGALHAELDHKNLNEDVSGLKDRPLTTESLAKFIYERLNAVLPVVRVRLHERPDFFAEYHADDKAYLGMERNFSAAHRLHSPALDDRQNRDLYEKCNNPQGHGHLYRVEATLGGTLDPRSGTVNSFGRLRDSIDSAVDPWRDKHLDLETDDFTRRPSTSENMVSILWPRINEQLDRRLVRLRLWETPNNRFTLRLDPAGDQNQGKV